MKKLRTVFLLVLLCASATILLAQSGASPAPSAQPTSVQNNPATTPGPQKASLTDQERQKEVAELDNLIERYGWKGNWYLALYYIFLLGSALAAALAGLVLQWDTPEKSFKRTAQILAFVGSAFAIVTTSVNLKVQSVANKTAYMECRDLRYRVSDGTSTDKAAIHKETLEIERRKTELALK